MLQIGTILGGTYQITEYIGSGGGGVVYKAFHTRLNVEVVVKQVRDEVRNKINSRQEADILKRLKHPYLPRVYDFIDTAEGVFTVMDFIPGQSLEDIMAQGYRIPQQTIVRWGQQLGEALAYLHSQKPVIIHSDIKPANIIITPEGNATLIDFNVSIFIDENTKSSVGISAGYAPPEQYRDLNTYQRVTNVSNIGNTSTERVFSVLTSVCSVITDMYGNTMAVVDARSDIFSLGAVLYHMAAGVQPHLDFNQIVPLQYSNVPISEGLAIIIDKMMRLMPNERYQNGGEYLAAIRNVHKLDRRYITMKRKEKMMGISAASFAILAGGLIGLGVHQMQVETDAYFENQILEANDQVEDFEYDDAIKTVTELQTDFSDRLSCYEREVYYMYLAADYENALDRAEEIFADQLVVENQYNSIETISNLYGIMANCAYETEDYVNAKNYIEEALDVYDDNATFHRDYAIILAKSGDLDKAQREIEKADRLGMDETSMSYVKAEIESIRGNYRDAIVLLEGIMDKKMDSNIYQRALLLAASDYMAISDNQNALRIFEEMYDAGVETYQVKENIGVLYENMGNRKEAENTFLELMDKYPNDYRVYKRLAILELDKQQYENERSRDYHQMKEYYDKAKDLYGKSKKDDAEMAVLDSQVSDVINGGWL